MFGLFSPPNYFLGNLHNLDGICLVPHTNYTSCTCPKASWQHETQTADDTAPGPKSISCKERKVAPKKENYSQYSTPSYSLFIFLTQLFCIIFGFNPFYFSYSFLSFFISQYSLFFPKIIIYIGILFSYYLFIYIHVCVHKNYFSPLLALTQDFILGQVKEKTSFFRTRACKSVLRICLLFHAYKTQMYARTCVYYYFYLYARKCLFFLNLPGSLSTAFLRSFPYKLH